MNTTANGVLNVAGQIVLVTGVFVVVSHPETAKVVSAVMNGFVGALKAASGQK